MKTRRRCRAVSGRDAVERVTSILFAAFLVVACCLVAFPLSAETQSPTHGMVSSVNPIATTAGLNVLKSGGNAIDAAVAVGLTSGVVDSAEFRHRRRLLHADPAGEREIRGD